MLVFAVFLVIAGVVLLSFTTRTIILVCAFYCCYGLITVLLPGVIPAFGMFTIYRFLYLILLLSLVVNLIRVKHFAVCIQHWSLVTYLAVIFIFLASSVYSSSSKLLSIDDPSSLLSRLVVMSLFWMAAGQIQDAQDLRIFAWATALTSVVLSAWVIWTAGQSDFATQRGGVLINENYVSTFILAGALPAVDTAFVQRNNLLRCAALAGLLPMIFASLILASRGMVVAAFMAATVIIVGRRRAFDSKRIGLISVILLLVLGAVLFLPGGANLLLRFEADDIATMNERVGIWSLSLNHFAGGSLLGMLFGQGLSSAAIVINPRMPGYENFHSMYLQWLMEQGLLGLAIFILFLYSVSRTIFRSTHPLRNVMVGWLAYLLVAGMTATISDLHFFWITLGVTIGVSAMSQRPSTISPCLESK